MTAHTLLQLRIDVRDRAHVSAKDPRYNDDVVNRAIQQAYGEVATARPGGWWFQRVEIGFGQFPADRPYLPLITGLPNYVEGVGYVYASIDQDYWVPIRRRTRTDAIRAAGGQKAPVDIPESWGVQYLGSGTGFQPSQLALVFDPPLGSNTALRVGLILGPVDFDDDTAVMAGLPIQFTGAVVERAAARLMRTRRDVGNLTRRRTAPSPVALADQAYEGWMRALRLFFGKPYGGPGYSAQHWRY